MILLLCCRGVNWQFFSAVIHWRYMITPVAAIVRLRTATNFQSSNETRVT